MGFDVVRVQEMLPREKLRIDHTVPHALASADRSAYSGLNHPLRADPLSMFAFI